MIPVKNEGVLLKPSKHLFDNSAVLNPTCYKKGNYVHMFYRAISKKGISSIGYCKLNGPMDIIQRSDNPILYTEYDYEKKGLEDPRITYINGIYYIFYTVYDGKNARVAYATSKNLKKFKKQSIITPELSYDEVGDIFRHSGTKDEKLKDQYFYYESYFKEKFGKDIILWEKDVMLFPKKINGKFALIHRILPDIQVIYFDNFKDLTLSYWKNYLRHLSRNIIISSKYWYESRNIGGGATPIKTKKGWLIIYHAVENSDDGKIYRANAALLDKNNLKLIGHLKQPLFSPEKKWEKKGDVNNVVFPTGTSIFGKRLYIYYGVTDTRIAVNSLDLNELLEELVKNKV